MRTPKKPHEAILLLQEMLRRPGHRFWEDDISIAKAKEIDRARLLGYRQVTDAHLLGLAIRRGGRVATFDRGVRELVPAGRSPDEVVQLIPAAAG